MLFTRLFPGAIMTGESADNVMAVPTWIYFEHSREIAELTWADIAGLVGGLFDAPSRTATRTHPQATEAGLAELIEAQDLARAALATPPGDDPPLRNRREIGLRAVRPDAAFRLDEVLRAEVTVGRSGSPRSTCCSRSARSSPVRWDRPDRALRPTTTSSNSKRTTASTRPSSPRRSGARSPSTSWRPSRASAASARATTAACRSCSARTRSDGSIAARPSSIPNVTRSAAGAGCATTSVVGGRRLVIHTLSQAGRSENRRDTVGIMERRTERSLAFDLLDTDLADAASLTELVVAHTITPVRAIYGLPAPRPGEGTSFLTMDRYEGEGDITIEVHRPFTMDESAAVFDPIARALLLFAWLFPTSVLSHNRAERILDEPGPAVLRGPDQLLLSLARAHGRARGRPPRRHRDSRFDWPGVFPHRPARNDEAMAELRCGRRRSWRPRSTRSRTRSRSRS